MSNNPFGNVPNGTDPTGGPVGPLKPPVNGFMDESFELDLSDPTITGVVPQGEYIARLVGVEKDISKAGNPTWVWEFVLLNSPVPTNSLKMWTALTSAAMWKVIENLTALGLAKAGEKANFNKSDAINRLCRVVIVHGERNNRINTDIERVLPYPGGVGSKWEPGMTFPLATTERGNSLPNTIDPFVQGGPEPLDETDEKAASNPFGRP